MQNKLYRTCIVSVKASLECNFFNHFDFESFVLKIEIIFRLKVFPCVTLYIFRVCKEKRENL